MEGLLFLGLVTVALVSGQAADVEYGQLCGGSPPPVCRSVNITDPIRCDGNRCVCENGLFRHANLNRCVSPHDGVCTLRSADGQPIFTCTSYAHCFPEGPEIPDGRETGRCYCEQDAVPDKRSGQCLLSYGSSRCSKETDCDVLSSLTCRDSKCVCRDSENQEYDSVDKKCKALVGGICTAELPYNAPGCLSDRMVCDDRNFNPTNPTNKCKCKAGFAENPDKTCGKGIGATCDINLNPSECHLHLECRNGTCGCPQGQIEHEDICRIAAGGNCTNTGLSCADHATCDDGVCVCSPEHLAESGRCVGLYGATCNNQTASCSTENYLFCGTDSTCKCGPNYEDDATNKLCKGHIEQQCRNTTDCIANSVCNANDNKCTCPENFIPSDDKKTCKGFFGTACTGNTECREDYFLSCANGQCSCQNGETQLREGENNRCVFKAGQAGCSDNLHCVTNSTCSNAYPRVCSCNEGNSASDEGQCPAGGGGGSGSKAIYGSTGGIAVVMMVIIGNNY